MAAKWLMCETVSRENQKALQTPNEGQEPGYRGQKPNPKTRERSDLVELA
ncbi:hypothetical protein QG37_03286 [Candidozyma auris]|uniref:Uncharacterized protein n=1 Tax=Candidozyma auris TaxID=498019 RepID=A0A0L0P0F2_CANAR|nr:hypothetical protein QG37_03286 [[Candida] auris]